MTDAYWCVLISALMPYVWVMISKRRKGYDNSAPRAGTGQLQPLQQRAYWAHENAFEAFGPFAAAVIIAHLRQAPPDSVALCAAIFVIARLGYGFAYLADRPNIRSGMWFIGFGSMVALFFV
jgi:uncharacterized MAPEG superfamily protein